MPIIVEDGTGLPDAQSYVSLEYATAYFASRGIASWAAAVEAEKEAALVRASSALDGRYGSRWPGYRSSQEQALSWPREYAYDVDGWDIDGLPEAVKKATCEGAMIELEDSGALSVALERGGAVIREKVGPLETEYSAQAPAGTVYQAITQALARIVEPGGVRVRRG